MDRRLIAGVTAAALTAAASAATYPVTGAAAPTQWQGRYRTTPSGGAQFDWPGTRVSFTVSGTTTVSMNLSAPGKLLGEIRVYLDGVNGSTILVGPSTEMYTVATGLDAAKPRTITLYNVLEPALWHPQPFLPSPPYDQAAVLNSINVDGALLTPPPPLKRNLVFVGDSITAGFGAGAEAPCGASPTYQEANDNTYGNMLCSNFTANCSIVAWSGKGLYVNSPTAGTEETLPYYYRSSLGVDPYSTDWDFGRFTPDAVVVNLGEGEDAGPHQSVQRVLLPSGVCRRWVWGRLSKIRTCYWRDTRWEPTPPLLPTRHQRRGPQPRHRPSVGEELCEWRWDE